MIRICNTDEFWSKMCDIRAVRVDRRTVAIGNDRYVTREPPEDVQGFIEDKITVILKVCKSGPWWADAMLLGFAFAAKWAWVLVVVGGVWLL